jgi:hypothetical protein
VVIDNKTALPPDIPEGQDSEKRTTRTVEMEEEEQEEQPQLLKMTA